MRRLLGAVALALLVACGADPDMPSADGALSRWERTGVHGSYAPEVRARAEAAVRAYGGLYATPPGTRLHDHVNANAVALAKTAGDHFTGEQLQRALAGLRAPGDDTYNAYSRYDLADVRHTYEWDSGDVAFVAFDAVERHLSHDGEWQAAPVRQIQVTLRRVDGVWLAERIESVSLVPGDRT